MPQPETQATVIYEVTCHVDADVADAWLAWIPGHVSEILAVPGMLSAEFWEIVDPVPARRRSFCLRYGARDWAALEAYLTDHAPRLRADGVARFGARYAAERRVGRVLRIGSER
jgi:hypothetical protein